MDMQARDTKELRCLLRRGIDLTLSNVRRLSLMLHDVDNGDPVQIFEKMKVIFRSTRDCADRCADSIYRYNRSWKNQQ